MKHLAEKHDVAVLDLKPPKSDLPFLQADILDLEAMKAYIRGYDAVAHLAAIPHPLNDPPEKVFQVNVMGSFNVLEACALNGIRQFIFTSSDATIGLVFGKEGRQPKYLPLDEDHPLEPEDPYGLSKLVGEEICWAYSRRYGINVTIIRPCWVWDKGDQSGTYRHMVEHPEEWANSLWNYIHAIDLACVFEAALWATWPSGCEAFLVSADDNGTRVPSRDLISRFKPEVTDFRVPMEGRAPFINAQKAKRMLGWQPEHTWEEVI